MVDVEQGQVGLDQLQHGGENAVLDDRSRFGLGHGEQLVAELGLQRLPDRDQIIARIEARGNLDGFAQGFAVAQECRAGERIDLAAGVVDVIFPRHLIARIGHERGQRIAEYGAAGVADMHGAGRVGRDIFDIDRFPAAQIGAAVIGALGGDGAQHLVPDGVGETEVDEAGTGDLHRGHIGVVLEMLDQRRSDFARVLAQRLGDDHGGIGTQIAMGGIARRLDHDAGEQVGTDFGVENLERVSDARGEQGENVHGKPDSITLAGLTEFRASVKQAGIFVDGVRVGHAGDEVGGDARQRIGR